MYKYKPGDTFIKQYNNASYIGTIIRIANLDEFGGDFYYNDKNYVVEFSINNISIASYNFSQPDCTYKYIMTESDI